VSVAVPEVRLTDVTRRIRNSFSAGRSRPGGVMREFFDEFKKFIMRGNVLDLAVAVVIGAAFNTVVQVFANGVLLQFVAAIFSQPSFNGLTFKINGAEILYGAFLTQLVNFVIVAFAVFIVVRSFDRLQNLRRRDAVEETPAASDEAVLLAEIRDLLRARA
jgi:large conductance mechanosensitive channel